MKRIADSQDRLAARDIFRPSAVFDVTPQPDVSIRVIGLTEKEVSVVKLKERRDGVFVSPVVLSREVVRAAIRADREAAWLATSRPRPEDWGGDGSSPQSFLGPQLIKPRQSKFDDKVPVQARLAGTLAAPSGGWFAHHRPAFL